MYVYGGYQDLRGSTSELWAFHLPSQTWHMVSQGGLGAPGAGDCPPKHHHSAVVHNDAMWVFGGMSDLQERSDCWKFDFCEFLILSTLCSLSIFPVIYFIFANWFGITAIINLCDQ